MRRLLFAGLVALAVTPPAGAGGGIPNVVLRSDSPRQIAGIGTGCMTGDGWTGCWEVAAPGAEPRKLSVVRPGEEVVIRVPGATSVKGHVAVQKYGCGDRVRRRFKLTGENTTWKVPGWFRTGRRFELQLRVDFVMADGRRGDTAAALGIYVSTTHPPALFPNRGAYSLACGAA